MGLGDSMVQDLIKVLRNYYHVLVGSLIRTNPDDLPTVEKDTPIDDLLRILTTRHHVWVVDSKENMKLIGLITVKDMLDVLTPRTISPYSIGGLNTKSLLFGKATTAEKIATKKLITADPYETIESVLLKMKRYKLRRLPVVKDGVLVGEITLKMLLVEYMKVLKWYRKMALYKNEEKKSEENKE